MQYIQRKISKNYIKNIAAKIINKEKNSQKYDRNTKNIIFNIDKNKKYQYNFIVHKQKKQFNIYLWIKK